jgi:hypothetical protein
MNEAWTRRLHTARQVMFAVAMLNFVTFVAIATYLGGDAVNGKVEAGHYYLFGVRSEYGHKVYTEVSDRVFNYSKWHVYCLCVTWALMLAVSIADNRIKKRSVGNI